MTLQQAAHSLTIVKTAHGKPYLADYPELVFNLSHTDDIFVIVLGWQCQLGIDIESHKERSTFSALVKKCFAPEEALYWQRLPVEQQTAAFYRFWTRKEAFVKATGVGIALGLQHCVINPEKPNYFLRIPSQCGDISHWQIQDIDFCQKHPGIYCALSTNKTMATRHVNTLLHFTSMTQ